MGLPGTDLNLRQKIKKVKLKKNRILLFEICPMFKSVPG